MGLGLIRAMNIVCINSEIIFTIVLPLQAWISSTSRRFLIILPSMWIIGFVFTEMVLPSIHADGCFLEDNHIANVAIHILLNWLPGFIVLALTIASIIAYSKGCFLTQMDTRDTRSREQNLQVRMRAHEWFRFLIIVNSQYFLLDLVLVEVIDNGLSQHDGHLMNIIYLTVAHELLRLVLPLSLLVISSVRSAICDGLCLPYTMILKCRKRNSQDEEALTMASAYADQLV